MLLMVLIWSFVLSVRSWLFYERQPYDLLITLMLFYLSGLYYDFFVTLLLVILLYHIKR